MLPDDPEESVRIAYAANIHKIAETANRFMTHSQEIHEIGGLDSPLNRAKGSYVERKLMGTVKHTVHLLTLSLFILHFTVHFHFRECLL